MNSEALSTVTIYSMWTDIIDRRQTDICHVVNVALYWAVRRPVAMTNETLVSLQLLYADAVVVIQCRRQYVVAGEWVDECKVKLGVAAAAAGRYPPVAWRRHSATAKFDCWRPGWLEFVFGPSRIRPSVCHAWNALHGCTHTLKPNEFRWQLRITQSPWQHDAAAQSDERWTTSLKQRQPTLSVCVWICKHRAPNNGSKISTILAEFLGTSHDKFSDTIESTLFLECVRKTCHTPKSAFVPIESEWHTVQLCPGNRQGFLHVGYRIWAARYAWLNVWSAISAELYRCCQPARS